MTDLQRGFYPIDLDRPRLLRFTLKETWLLVQKYGDGFLAELYEQAPGTMFGVRLKDPEVMKSFLLVGLSADAEAHGEVLTPEKIDDLITPVRFLRAFSSLMMAVTGTHAVPAGNERAGSAQAEEPAGAVSKLPASTSRKPKGGPQRFSGSRRRTSGR